MTIQDAGTSYVIKEKGYTFGCSIVAKFDDKFKLLRTDFTVFNLLQAISESEITLVQNYLGLLLRNYDILLTIREMKDMFDKKFEKLKMESNVLGI